MRAISIAAVLLLLSIVSFAQQPPSLDEGYRDMYNLQFDAAHQFFQSWENSHPADALGPVSNAAAYLFAEFDRLHVLETELFTNDDKFQSRSKLAPDPKSKQAFDAELNKAEHLADSILSREPRNSDARFAKVLSLGLRGDYAAMIEKRDLAGLSYMKSGRLLAEKLLADDPNYYDAYLAVGIENYLLSLRAAPMRWVLRLTGAETDKQTGLNDLRVTADKGNYLKPYARLLLAVAALRDNDKPQAKKILAGLSQEFPQNQLYAKELAKLQPASN